ncbi:hypothetical protein L6452_01187 [Arctium lappa]|uniref:Uncharacterized protein n=1 Tax=Arctium lappa TaxID=4217 RepID=A0ACB9FH89_ARCLA|nr:hypothetical protein L6452_01187 [Arctium lappa]
MEAVLYHFMNPGKALHKNDKMAFQQFWQGEAARMRQQLQYLQQSHRQLFGEELSGLNVKDLQKLENQLETSLKNVRINKEHIFTDEIKELHREGNLIVQENKELHNKVNLLHQEKANLQKKIYGLRTMDEANRNSNASYSLRIDLTTLQLSQPQPLKNDIPADTMKLR